MILGMEYWSVMGISRKGPCEHHGSNGVVLYGRPWLCCSGSSLLLLR